MQRMWLESTRPGMRTTARRCYICDRNQADKVVSSMPLCLECISTHSIKIQDVGQEPITPPYGEYYPLNDPFGDACSD